LPKTLSEVKSFLARERLASFATVDSKNRPHVVPLFFTYNDGKVFLQADRKSVKVRNIVKNRNVAIAIYSGEEAVIVKGAGRLIVQREEFVKRTQEHIDKYGLKLDKQGRDSLGIPLFNDKIRCVVEVMPKRLIFW